MDQWGKNGGPAQYINHSCDSNCESVQRRVDSVPCMCFFAKKKTHSGMELTFDYNWELVNGQVGMVCLCGSDNCDGKIEKKRKKW